MTCLRLPKLFLIGALSAMIMPVSANAISGPDFVAEFASTCLPERMSFENTVDLARSNGWQDVKDDQHPEFHAMMKLARKYADDPEFPDWTFQMFGFSRTISDTTLYLVSSVVKAPQVITLNACHLYDLDATKAIDPAPVSEMLNHSIAYYTGDEGGDFYIDPSQMVSYVWGPPPSLPRLFDTHLSFIPEQSAFVEKTGFSGLMLKFSTSVPQDPGQTPQTND